MFPVAAGKKWKPINERVRKASSVFDGKKQWMQDMLTLEDTA